MNKSNHIVTAIDFSPCSADALRQAIRIAAWNKAVVHAVHVLPPPIADPSPGAIFPMPMYVERDLEAAAREQWDRFATDCPGKQDLKLEVLWGSPREEILDLVKRVKADLLVLGAHSEHDTRRGIGTTAAACARRARAKVLLVQPKATKAFKAVAVCVDFSDTSRLALEQAVRVAAQDGAALHIAHIYNNPWWGMKPPEEVTKNMPFFVNHFREAVVERVRAFTRPLDHELNALKPSYHAVQHDETWAGHGEGLVRFFNAEGIDLAVLGVRSKWNIRDVLMGSTAERVVRDAACCVLTVRPENAE